MHTTNLRAPKNYNSIPSLCFPSKKNYRKKKIKEKFVLLFQNNDTASTLTHSHSLHYYNRYSTFLDPDPPSFCQQQKNKGNTHFQVSENRMLRNSPAGRPICQFNNIKKRKVIRRVGLGYLRSFGFVKVKGSRSGPLISRRCFGLVNFFRSNMRLLQA